VIAETLMLSYYVNTLRRQSEEQALQRRVGELEAENRKLNRRLRRAKLILDI
jgi:hypothetical protein